MRNTTIQVEREALIALAHAVEPGDSRIGALIDEWGALQVFERMRAGRLGLREQAPMQARLARVDVESALASAHAIGARIIDRTDREWPTQLDDLGAARPLAVWVLGAANLRLTALRSIAVVGARAATAYGEAICRDWCSVLAEHSFTVVSGGAYGIDAAAHRATLSAEGMTICVLASGVDTPYPRAHDALVGRIADEGLVVSESPLGQQVRRQRFLTRNRLIAALTRATLVVEAAVRSGTTSTANAAMALNRPVLAVPGPVTSVMSGGCHKLIRDTDTLLASRIEDVLEVIGELGEFSGPAQERRSIDDLSPSQARVLDAIPARGSIGINDLVIDSGLGAADVSGALAVLALRGFVEEVPGGWRLAGRA
ncbi:MAG: DNA-processing protein DprA [Candidatus Nanopelagicales bacterium]|jgi:DNA processing protein